MKKHLLLFAIIALAGLAGCRKNSNNPGGGGGNGGGGNGGGGGTKPKQWYVKSYISKADNTSFSHTIFVYDSLLRITRIGGGLSGLKDTFNQSVQTFTDYVYDKDGKLLTSKTFQSPPIKYVYLNANSIQVTADPFDAGHDGVTYYYFNARSHGELDQIKSYIPPGNLFAGTTAINYAYNDDGGVQSESDLQENGTNTDIWAYFSAGTVTPIDNPFSTGKTMEQRFLYDTHVPFNAADMMGIKWSSGIYESYTYTTGQKEPYVHFWNQYKVDSNGLVVAVTKQYTYVGDKTGAVVTANPIYITYEQH